MLDLTGADSLELGVIFVFVDQVTAFGFAELTLEDELKVFQQSSGLIVNNVLPPEYKDDGIVVVLLVLGHFAALLLMEFVNVLFLQDIVGDIRIQVK